LGDTYFGSGKGAGGDGNSKESFTFTEKETRICNYCKKEFVGWKFQNFCGSSCSGVDNTPRTKKGKMSDKTLCQIPSRFAIEMCNRGWILRNTIIWHKPNCMPSSVKDRFTVDFEYVFFFVKSKKYFFEMIYEPTAKSTIKRGEYGWHGTEIKGKRNEPQATEKMGDRWCNPKGRNKRTVWSICPKPFKEAHFAVYPEELCETPLKAGCPEFVCNKCGKAREKIIDYERYETRPNKTSKYSDEVYINSNRPLGLATRTMNKQTEKGLTNCNCNAGFNGGICLDPFFGAGTTGLVALKQNKQFIGIELNKSYISIAEKRLKPYLEQEKLEI